MEALRGTWMVTFSDGVGRARNFHGRNQVTSKGTKGARLYRRRGDLIIEYRFGKLTVIERITVVDGRLFIENFNPELNGKTYPKGPPGLLGIGTKLK